MADWREELSGWLASFLNKLGHKARRRLCPLYVAGVILNISIVQCGSRRGWVLPSPGAKRNRSKSFN